MKCKTCGTDHRGVAKHGGYCLDHQEKRAEAAEAHAAMLQECLGPNARILNQRRDDQIKQLTAERDELRRQLEQAKPFVLALKYGGDKNQRELREMAHDLETILNGGAT